MTKITNYTLEKVLDIAIRAIEAERKVEALEKRVESLLDQNSKLREHNARIFTVRGEDQTTRTIKGDD